MNACPLFPQCGGCSLRMLDEEAYRQKKYASFKQIITHINQQDIFFGEPVFIKDGTRRRASFTFSFAKKTLHLGFNGAQSHEIIDRDKCLLLTDRLNKNIPHLRTLLQDLCSEPYIQKKNKKILNQYITSGEVLVSEADNGIDVLFEMPSEPELNHRMIIAEHLAKLDDVIRVSWHKAKASSVETILEKTKPMVKNSEVSVYIPSGTFLQASKEGEQALIGLVKRYLKNKEGKIADLFCGVGTFSYPLSRNLNNKILAIDSSEELLTGFRQSVNRNQIKNIKIESRNLFKYPLDEKELTNIDVVVFDPPRAGAAAQTAQISACLDGPETVIAVSCNPYTFVNDANTLIKGGYTLKEVTMVDQFIYSSHTELVALFEKE
ncbi:MAG: class I SAM-dependent RNA methyltransferase [Alphaproteobacteria bacterium]|nr:class I SAM-dependent RNA methyltransferase [Alphaproteobacteria bacterium]